MILILSLRHHAGTCEKIRTQRVHAETGNLIDKIATVFACIQPIYRFRLIGNVDVGIVDTVKNPVMVAADLISDRNGDAEYNFADSILLYRQH